ncbi:Uncharacterised protein [Candidatus Burarchaeum australiense]|nr:Uncharacterised protein [Candidatus Burarchaeum australiense]
MESRKLVVAALFLSLVFYGCCSLTEPVLNQALGYKPLPEEKKAWFFSEDNFRQLNVPFGEKSELTYDEKPTANPGANWTEDSQQFYVYEAGKYPDSFSFHIQTQVTECVGVNCSRYLLAGLAINRLFDYSSTSEQMDVKIFGEPQYFYKTDRTKFDKNELKKEIPSASDSAIQDATDYINYHFGTLTRNNVTVVIDIEKRGNLKDRFSDEQAKAYVESYMAYLTGKGVIGGG